MNNAIIDGEIDFQSSHIYALEVQSNFSIQILNGKKIIETREYPIPFNLINQPILLLQSSQGKDGISSLPDMITHDDIINISHLSIVGIMYVSECFQYTCQDKWNTDRINHCVPLESNYNWNEQNDQGIKKKYGWRIANVHKYDVPKELPNIIHRLYRSFFDCGLKSELQQLGYL